MASRTFSTLLLSFSFFISLISPSQSLTCTSQKFTNNNLFDHCTDLPQLTSYLHWSYNSAKSSISIAFIAAPAKPDGWISWAINPTGTGMAGAQALVAFKDSDGLMTVKTFNISSYSSIVPGKLSIDVKNMSAEFSDGLMKIFATVGLPEKGKTTVNQVWQVGPAVADGFPAKHEFQQANLNSKGTLDLLSGQSNGGAAGDSRTKKRNVSLLDLIYISLKVCFPNHS
ncbi:hypothetical protein LguiB_030886 [Lonicera macranthoides]